MDKYLKSKASKKDNCNNILTVKHLCTIAGVSRSGYYYWLNYSVSQKADKDYDDYLIINKIFVSKKKKAGWRVIRMELEDENIIMNHKKIRRIMKKYNMIAQVRKPNPYKRMAKATKEHMVAKNILNRKFAQQKPLTVLLTDITYLYYNNGQKAYLSAVKDVASKDIVSFYVGKDLSLTQGIHTVEQLEHKYSKEELAGCIIHSDQGFHYTSPHFREVCNRLGLTQSMSRKGNCIDNAPMESFFGHLKDEVDYRHCKTFEELKDLISNYIHHYNYHRKQWGLKKMTPIQYRNHLLVA